jgi:DNA-binding response OmpR family regulator
MTIHRILLVGKYSPDFEILRSDLTRSGYEILTSRGLKEAFRILESTPLEWVLSDIHLEEGNGIDLCWSARNLSRQSHIPFVILSDIDDEEVRLNAYRAGANLYLQKPISLRSLLVRLEALHHWQKKNPVLLANQNLQVLFCLIQMEIQPEGLLS